MASGSDEFLTVGWSISIYTVDASGHPAAEHATLAAPQAYIAAQRKADLHRPSGRDHPLRGHDLRRRGHSRHHELGSTVTGGSTTELDLEVTTSNGENVRSASDWSIFDAFDYRERQQLVGGHGRQGAVHRRPGSPGPGQAHRPKRHPLGQ